MGTESIAIGRYAGKPPVSGGEIAERASLMRSSPLFGGLSAAECSHIAERGRLQSFVRNDLLFMQGQPLQRVTIVESGCVKLTHLNPNGSEVILGLRGFSDALDVPAIFPNWSHAFTAQAMVKGRTLSWSVVAIENMVATIPQLSSNICRILGGQLAELQERYYELSVEKVERRVATALVRLAGQIGTPAIGGTEVAISRQELAQLTGTTLFTVSRLLSRWRELGFVVPRREAVILIKQQSAALLHSVEQALTAEQGA